MKPSKYNHFVEWQGVSFGVNLLTGGKIFLQKNQTELFRENSPAKIDEVDPLLFQLLKEAGFYIEDGIDEFDVLRMRYLMSVYNNSDYRMTIMPTLDCNLRCWYCYEKHIPGIMSQPTMDRVVQFVGNIIRSGDIHSFHLDWFGGEPLMHFDNVMYPLARRIKDLAYENRVVFTNSITTNGVLIDAQRIEKFQEIELNAFQITFDGNKVGSKF